MSPRPPAIVTAEFLGGALKDFSEAHHRTIILYLGANGVTWGEWLAGKQKPHGEYALRLLFILSHIGHSHALIKGLHPLVAQAGRVFAFKVLTIDEIAERVYPGSKVPHARRDALFRVLWGRGGPSKAVLANIGTILAETSIGLQKAEAAFDKMFMRTRVELLECLRAFAQEASPEQRENMRVFLDVTHQTADRWVSGEHTLIGENALRLMHALDILGYRASLLDDLDPKVADLGKLIAFRVLTQEEICDLIWDTDLQNRQKRVADVLFARSAPTEKRLKDIVELVGMYAVELADAIAAFREPFKVPEVPEKTVPLSGVPVSALIADPDKTELTEKDRSVVVTSLSGYVKALLPHAQLVLSDSFSGAERNRLRELCGEELFRLSNALNRLCGETARSSLSTQPSRRT